jgi:hypothetical protein
MRTSIERLSVFMSGNHPVRQPIAHPCVQPDKMSMAEFFGHFRASDNLLTRIFPQGKAGRQGQSATVFRRRPFGRLCIAGTSLPPPLTLRPPRWRFAVQARSARRLFAPRAGRDAAETCTRTRSP